MGKADVDRIVKDLAEINEFVRERLEPAGKEMGALREETKRLKAAVTDLQARERDLRRESISRYAEGGQYPVVESGPYAGMDMLDLGLLRRFAHSQRRESFGQGWIDKVEEARHRVMEMMTPAAIRAAHRASASRPNGGHAMEGGFGGPQLQAITRAAMDSTSAGLGDELVATLEARELWMDVNLQTLVSPLIPVFMMPSSPFDIPMQLGDVNFYPGTENTAAAITGLATAKATLTAFELVGHVPYSFTLEEDAVVAMLPEIRSGLVRNVAEVLDDVILNADRTRTNNINADEASIADRDPGIGHWLLGYDGLIHLPLVDNTGQSNDHAAGVSDDMFNEIRAKLGKYGARPSELAWVMDVNTFIRAQSIDNFRTMDKLGPNATLVTGMLGAIEGIPVIVSEQMRLADQDGKVTDGGNDADTGRVLILNRTQWAQGFRREMSIDVDRDTQKRQTVVTVSFRHALTERTGNRSSATHTALQYNVTDVS